MDVSMQPFQCLVIASLVVLLDAQTALEEVKANAIPVKFYQLRQSKWLDNEAKFRRALADDANDFCASNSEACGFPTEWRKESLFKEQDVKIQSTKAGRIYFSLQLYLVLPSNLSKPELTKTRFILHKDATGTIVANSRKDLAAGVGAPIVVIGEDEYTPSPNHTRNIVLICISFVVVLIVSAIAIYFKIKESRKRDHLRMKVLQQKAASRSSSREHIAIVRPTEKEPVILVSSADRPDTLEPPLKHFKEPGSNDHGQRKQERESFLHLRGRQAPYALPESSIIQAPQDGKVKYKPWKQSDKSGHETPV